MNKTFTLLTLILFFQSISIAQNGKWHFGQNISLNFQGTSVPTANSSSSINTNEGSSTAVDGTGNLLFYTDGIRIYDSTGVIINPNNLLGGDPSSTHSAIIIPLPSSECSKFLIFTTGGCENPSFNNGLEVSIVTVVSSPSYAITFNTTELRKKVFNNGVRVTEKLAAIMDQNGDFWVAAHGYSDSNNPNFKKTYITIKVSSNFNINSINPILSVVGLSHDIPALAANANAQGQMKFSPDGRYIASVMTYAKVCEVMNFNMNNGTVTSTFINFDAQTISGFPLPIFNFYGVEFSPSSRFIYISQGFRGSSNNPSKIFRFDLNDPNVLATLELVVTNNPPTSNGYPFSSLQLGPDGKIYIALNATNRVGVIINPDEPILQFIQTSLNYVIVSGGGCKLGLPSIIQGIYNCSFKNSACDCSNIGLTSTSSSFNTTGIFRQGINLNVNSQLSNIREIRANIVNFRFIFNNSNCISPSIQFSKDVGVFTNQLNFAQLSQFSSPVLSAFSPQFPTPSWSNEIVWKSLNPGGATIQQGNIPTVLFLKFPGVNLFNDPSCSIIVNFAIRFSFIGNDCSYCEKTIYRTGTLGQFTGRESFLSELNIPNSIDQIESYCFYLTNDDETSNSVTFKENCLDFEIFSSGEAISIRTIDKKLYDFQIFDITGKLLFDQINSTQVDISSIFNANGVYIIQVKNRECVTTKKIYIQKNQ